MTVESSISSVTYVGNGVATQFPYSFRIPDASNAQVILLDLTTFVETPLSPTQYGLSGIDNDDGGYLTYPLSGSPMGPTQSITLMRVLPIVQQTDIVNQSAFYPETIEDALDYLTMLIQQQQDVLSRVLTIPPGSGLDANTFLSTILEQASDAEIWAAAANSSAVLSAYWASIAQAFAVGAAVNITYDPVVSGLASTNVQAAIDEIASGVVSSTAFVGQVADCAAVVVPALWLACDGSAKSRSTYSALWTALHRESVVTITVASPAVVSWTAHGLNANDQVFFSTTGALPTGVTAGTAYYVVGSGLTANTFKIATTPGGAALNTSGSQSGTHTIYYSPYGIGDGTTTFTLPDAKHRATFGYDIGSARLTDSVGSGIDGRNLGKVGGSQDVTLGIGQIPSHTHQLEATTIQGTTGGAVDHLPTSTTGNPHDQGPVNSGPTGGSQAHNNVPPGIVFYKIIYAGV